MDPEDQPSDPAGQHDAEVPTPPPTPGPDKPEEFEFDDFALL